MVAHQHKWREAEIAKTDEDDGGTRYTYVWRCACGAVQTGVYREYPDVTRERGTRVEKLGLTVVEPTRRLAD